MVHKHNTVKVTRGIDLVRFEGGGLFLKVKANNERGYVLVPFNRRLI
tara:strand:- start:639 stop:779 length:141 start_codon:yes stop_codon:yes gene_type:complete